MRKVSTATHKKKDEAKSLSFSFFHPTKNFGNQEGAKTNHWKIGNQASGNHSGEPRCIWPFCVHCVHVWQLLHFANNKTKQTNRTVCSVFPCPTTTYNSIFVIQSWIRKIITWTYTKIIICSVQNSLQLPDDKFRIMAKWSRRLHSSFLLFRVFA